MAKLKPQRETDYTIPVRVTEYLDHRMSLRKILEQGEEESSGTRVELSISGTTMLIMVGAFGGTGRQIAIPLSTLVEDVLTNLTKKPGADS